MTIVSHGWRKVCPSTLLYVVCTHFVIALPPVVTLPGLMMRTYVVVRDFRCRLNREGRPYGWQVAVYTTPEKIWGYDAVTSAYREKPEASRGKVYGRVRRLYPLATEGQIRKILK